MLMLCATLVASSVAGRNVHLTFFLCYFWKGEEGHTGRSSTAKKTPAPRDAASKVSQRLRVLKLAGELGNVAEACRQRAWTEPASAAGSAGSRPQASTARRTFRRFTRAFAGHFAGDLGED